jgi:hypothetical protein
MRRRDIATMLGAGGRPQNLPSSYLKAIGLPASDREELRNVIVKRAMRARGDGSQISDCD